MSFSVLINKTRSSTTPLKLTNAITFSQRFLGLMGRKSIDSDKGLLFINAHSSRLDASIHMLFMRFDITVLWLNDAFQIVDKVIAKKWHLNYSPKEAAKYILETHVSRFNDYAIGDQIEVQ